MKKGVPETIAVPEFVPLAKLLDDIREFGGKLLIGGPCIKNRGIAPDDLVEGAEVVAGGRFVAEFASATNTLVY
jgi:predicted peroxiredoxin